MVTRQISKSEFKARALEFLREVEATGRPLIVTDHGRPAVEVRPVARPSSDALEALRGSVNWLDDSMDPVLPWTDWEALR